MANLAVGLFRAVGTALVCRSTSTSSLRTTTTRAQTRPRRGSGASRHPQHRHMQTTPQSTQLPRPPQQSQQPMQVQRPKTSRGPPSSLQLRGPDDDVNETNLQSNAYPGASSFYTARSENHRTSDVRPLPPLPTQQQPEGEHLSPIDVGVGADAEEETQADQHGRRERITWRAVQAFEAVSVESRPSGPHTSDNLRSRYATVVGKELKRERII
ncbi:hypothetical protein PG996_016029 [Apiospora saccharicola]|uniref:Uncharacterized protein n=1 Tax=Apiospora saccharicola TaxID=335842 RepID=A0ABR1TMS0_9PEZI